MSQIQAHVLPGERLHLQHGPIDLIIGADPLDGRAATRHTAFSAAKTRFGTVLPELMSEITLLRQAKGPAPKGPIAQRMWQVAQAQSIWATPMAAVAGAVAENILTTLIQSAPLARAYVNNGGDIALHLTKNTQFSIAIAHLDGRPEGKITLTHTDPIRGIATSGQGGRSLSMGIAESVTVLAQTAAEADIAATLITNATDLPGHRAITRHPAHYLRDETDLEDRLVVTHVDPLSPQDTSKALQNGLACAQNMQRCGLIHSAHLHLQGHSATTSTPQESLAYA